MLIDALSLFTILHYIRNFALQRLSKIFFNSLKYVFEIDKKVNKKTINYIHCLSIIAQRTLRTASAK